MTAQERDRIECAIRHIKTAIDIDPWAVEIAVEAMKTQLSAEGTTSDLISRQAAIDLCDWYDNPSMHDDLEKMPAAEPEIIHCRECKHLEYDSIFDGHFCQNRRVKLDHYCGYAERRTDGM